MNFAQEYGVSGIERFYHEAAYIAALMVYLIEHKTDNEADEEIAGLLKEKPFLLAIVISVMESERIL